MDRNLRDVSRARVHRTGALLAEAMVGLAVMLVVVTTFSTLCFRIHNVWREVGYQRVAMMELSNQLEYLTQLDTNELASKLEALTPSEACRRTLNQPVISGHLEESKLGTRIVLELNWQRAVPSHPMRLVGWSCCQETKQDGTKKVEGTP